MFSSVVEIYCKFKFYNNEIVLIYEILRASGISDKRTLI
jgi:hypothetical protein